MWIGDNLYKSGFAQAIVNGDATVGNAFVQAIDKLRLALGNKKSRSHTNLAVVERLFMRALENEVQTREGSGEYAFVGVTQDGIEVFKTSKDVMNLKQSDRIRKFRNDFAASFKGRTAKLIRNGHVFYAQFDDTSHGLGKFVYETKGKERSDDPGRRAKIRLLADGDIFEIVENSNYEDTEKEQGKNTKAHKDALHWDYFYKSIFVDGKGYDITINVRMDVPGGDYTKKSRCVYSIDFVANKKQLPPGTIITQSNSSVNSEATANTTVSQNVPGVKNYSMQNGKKNSSSGQLSFLPPEIMEQENGRKGNIYQEEGEREAYFSEDGDTSSVTADAATPSPQGEGYDGAIDENGEAIRKSNHGNKTAMGDIHWY